VSAESARDLHGFGEAVVCYGEICRLENDRTGPASVREAKACHSGKDAAQFGPSGEAPRDPISSGNGVSMHTIVELVARTGDICTLIYTGTVLRDPITISATRVCVYPSLGKPRPLRSELKRPTTCHLSFRLPFQAVILWIDSANLRVFMLLRAAFNMLFA
jgi:hypothetical protein